MNHRRACVTGETAGLDVRKCIKGSQRKNDSSNIGSLPTHTLTDPTNTKTSFKDNTNTHWSLSSSCVWWAENEDKSCWADLGTGLRVLTADWASLDHFKRWKTVSHMRDLLLLTELQFTSLVAYSSLMEHIFKSAVSNVSCSAIFPRLTSSIINRNNNEIELWIVCGYQLFNIINICTECFRVKCSAVFFYTHAAHDSLFSMSRSACFTQTHLGNLGHL